MIVIPTGTDAPIYHWPYATVALIVLNVALRVAVPPVAGTVRLDEQARPEVPPGSLPADLEAARERLARKAQQMLEEGVLELEGDD